MIATALVPILNFTVMTALYYQSQINERTRIEIETLRAELEYVEEKVRSNHGTIPPTD